MKKSILYLGISTYVILLSLAVVFYLERTVFIDIAFHLFYILKDGDFAIQNNRFGAALTQLFPLVGCKLQLELESIMKWYSVSFVLINFTYFVLISLVFKLWRYAIVLLLFNLLMVSHTFYWVQSEFGQGLSMLILFSAFIKYVDSNGIRHKFWVMPVHFIFLFTLVFFHPLMFIPFLFVIMYQWMSNEVDTTHLKQVLLSFLGLFVIKYLFFGTAYDTQSSSGLKNFLYLFPNYFNLTSNRLFLQYAFGDYFVLMIAMAWLCFYFFRSRNWKKLLLITSFFIGYTLLVNVSFPHGGEQFYMENLYLPLSIFVAFPLVFEVSTKLKHLHFLIGLILVIAIRLIQIGFTHQIYTERVAFLEAYLDQTKDLELKKIVKNPSETDKESLMMDWATPYEFWLLSTVKTGVTRSIMITENQGEIIWAKDHKYSFITPWGVFRYDELPNMYFNFRDSTSYDFK